MAESKARVTFLRKGYSGNIWGLTLEDGKLLAQYPCKNIEEAVEFFKKNYGEDLRTLGIQTIDCGDYFIYL